MVFKRIFGGAPEPSAGEEYTIEDLIVLERYDEAADRLEARVKKNPRDLHAHLRLADVQLARKLWLKAVDEYVFVADCYAEDGFYDKAIALLSRAGKLAPLDSGVKDRAARFQALKSLEHSRAQFIEGLSSAAKGDALERLSTVEMQMVWRRLGPTRFIRSLPPEQLRRLVSGMELRTYETGRTLAVRGGTDRVAFLLVSGVVEAVLEGAAVPAGGLRHFTTGDLLGDWPLLEQRPWPATLLAVEAVTLLALTREGLERALQGNPDPRCLLEALRSQRLDQDLAASIQRFLRPPSA